MHQIPWRLCVFRSVQEASRTDHRRRDDAAPGQETQRFPDCGGGYFEANSSTLDNSECCPDTSSPAGPKKTPEPTRQVQGTGGQKLEMDRPRAGDLRFFGPGSRTGFEKNAIQVLYKFRI